MTKARYVRTGDHLDDDDIVVVRGGDLDRAILRADAERYRAIYGVPGISVFAAREVTVDELAQQPPLVRFRVLTLMRVGTLRGAGLDLVPTGRNPRHFTVAFADLQAGVDALVSCDHRRWVNPYHDE